MQFSAIPVNAIDASRAGIDITDNLFISHKSLDVSAGYMSYSPAYLPTGYMSINADYCLNETLTFSLDGIYGMGSEYDVYNSGGFKSGVYKPSEMLIGLGAGYRFLDYLSADVKLKYMTDKPASETSYGAFAADIAVTGMFEFSENARIAAECGAYSIGSKVSSASGHKFSFPSSIGLSGAYMHDLNEKNSLNFLLKGNYYLHKAFSAAVAAEAKIADIASVSLGYCLGAKYVLPSFVSVGAGVHFTGIRINAAYMYGNKSVSNSIALSLGYSF